MNLVKAIDLYIMQVDNILYCVAEDDWWNGRKHFRRKDPRVLEYCQYTTVQMLTGTLPYLLLTVQSMEVLCSLLTDH